SIAKASREQAAAIDEVSVAVRTLDEMTQHNAALVEETNAAIEQTEAQASELDRVVDIFTIEETDKGVAKRAPAQARCMVDKVRSAARSYLRQGNAAFGTDWPDFWRDPGCRRYWREGAVRRPLCRVSHGWTCT